VVQRIGHHCLDDAADSKDDVPGDVAKHIEDEKQLQQLMPMRAPAAQQNTATPKLHETSEMLQDITRIDPTTLPPPRTEIEDAQPQPPISTQWLAPNPSTSSCQHPILDSASVGSERRSMHDSQKVLTGLHDFMSMWHPILAEANNEIEPNGYHHLVDLPQFQENEPQPHGHSKHAHKLQKANSSSNDSETKTNSSVASTKQTTAKHAREKRARQIRHIKTRDECLICANSVGPCKQQNDGFTLNADTNVEFSDANESESAFLLLKSSVLSGNRMPPIAFQPTLKSYQGPEAISPASHHFKTTTGDPNTRLSTSVHGWGGLLCNTVIPQTKTQAWLTQAWLGTKKTEAHNELGLAKIDNITTHDGDKISGLVLALMRSENELALLQRRGGSADGTM